MELLPTLEFDEYDHVTVAEFDGWIVKIASMLVNYRVTLYAKEEPLFPAYGWCFPSGLAAWAAVRAWNPDAEGEPIGYVKATLPIRRQPGETVSEYRAKYHLAL